MQIREDTKPPLLPEREAEKVEEAKDLQVTIIKKPDTQTQSREISERSQFVGAAFYIAIGRTQKKQLSTIKIPDLDEYIAVKMA